jgi:hypothetical protein
MAMSTAVALAIVLVDTQVTLALTVQFVAVVLLAQPPAGGSAVDVAVAMTLDPFVMST